MNEEIKKKIYYNDYANDSDKKNFSGKNVHGGEILKCLIK